MLKKYVLDLRVTQVQAVHERYVLIKLTHEFKLPPMQPGQFVEVRVDGSPSTFLRRPISINFIDEARNELWLLVAVVGDGTRCLSQLQPGDRLNCLLPLGNGFTLPSVRGEVFEDGSTLCASEVKNSPKVLLVGGGVGVAPLLYLGKVLSDGGVEPTFLLGARTQHDLLMPGEFERYGRLFVTTEDGSLGEQGFVTNHSLLYKERFDLIQTCGPTPMMKAVARYAHEQGITCEASLENLMACGLGACLCCVEKTTSGNVCVCKEGPVFNTSRLLWN
jgi:dihydroorotate dehydrogenase electron transfer subunit